MTTRKKELNNHEIQELMRREPAHVQRYYKLLQQEVERRERRHIELKGITSSPAGRAAVRRFTGYATVVVLIALAARMGRLVQHLPTAGTTGLCSPSGI